MITGKLNRTDTTYFAIEKDSSSSLKCFADDRKKYYRKYVLGEQIDEVDEESKAILIGNLVDCLLLIPEEFDTRFFKSTGEEKPTGQMLDFVNYLYEETINAIDEHGMVTSSFTDRAKIAYERVGFKRDKFEKVFGERFPVEGKAYYDEIMEVRPKGLQVITTQDYENALKIIETLKSNQFVKDIINQDETDRVEVHNQLVVEFMYKENDFKVMMDKVIVDYDAKTVQGYDLKVTWNVDDFYRGYYLYRKAYIQHALYTIALNHWMIDLGFDDYELLPFIFIVSDSINYNAPLLYKTSEQSLINAIKGFEDNGRKYKGVNELIEDLHWHKQEQVWNISAENYKNRGIITI